MNYSTLPFDLKLPAHPILLDVQALSARVQTVTDRRAARGKRYPLGAILIIAVLAKLTGANQVRDGAEWARHRQHERCVLFGLTRPTMPHPTTWSRILGEAVDPDALTRATEEVLTSVASEVPERGSVQVTLDGKTLRGTIPAGQTQGVHLLAAYRPQDGVGLLQVEVGATENESSAAPRVLQQLDLRGILVSGDAMFTQRDLCVQIVQQGGVLSAAGEPEAARQQQRDAAQGKESGHHRHRALDDDRENGKCGAHPERDK
jgi:predicted transposase YbfD/YdcC